MYSSVFTILNEELEGIFAPDNMMDENMQIRQLKEAHVKQLSILQTAIAEERDETARNQKLFEETLNTKYNHLVSALMDKVKLENETKLQHALNALELTARNESERSKFLYDAQQEAEKGLSVKLKTIVNELRKSWEIEEIARSKHLEERLRAHYSTVLEHMEAQLQMALQLQDDANKRWMDDEESRMKQQVDAMKLFETKCKHLYDTRLKEMTDQTSRQLAQYEEHLLQSGTKAAIEREKLEGRQRRMKLACHRWKVEYQKDVDERYREMASFLENKYLDEVQLLLEENANLAMGINADVANMNAKNGQVPVSDMRLRIQRGCKENGFTNEELIAMLSSLLDTAQCSALMQVQYEKIMIEIKKRRKSSGLGFVLADRGGVGAASAAALVSAFKTSKKKNTPPTSTITVSYI